VSPQPISRRSTFTGLAASVAGGVAGFAFARNSSAAKRKSGTTAANGYGASTAASSNGSGGTLLAPLARVPAGGGVILSKSKIVLTRGTDGTVHGFSAVCTHQGCTVDSVRGGVINCPCHASRFDAQTGAVVGGPAPSPLPEVAVVVRGSDVFSA
jgi:Rieske Fe-S protein